MSTFYCILTSLMIIFGCYEQSLAQVNRKSDKIQLALTYEDNGDTRNAARLYQELLSDNPNNKDYLYGVARTLTQLKRYSELLPIIEAFSTDNPSIDIFCLLSQTSQRAGLLNKSDIYFEKALSFVTKSSVTPEIIVQVAESQVSIFKFTNAIIAYSKGRELLSNKKDLFAEELSQIYSQIGDYEHGMEEILAVFKQQQNFNSIQGRIAALLINKEASMYIDKALVNELNKTDNTYAFSKLYIWYLRETKRFDEAFAFVVTLDSDLGLQGRELMDFADVTIKDGLFDYAIKSYGKVIDKGKSNPYFSGAMYGYAKALEQKLGLNQRKVQSNISKEDINNIISRYEDIIAQFPNNQLSAECLYRIGLLNALYLQDIDTAIDIFIQLRTHYSQFPICANGNNELVQLYISKGLLSKAEDIAKQNLIGYAKSNIKESERSQFLLGEIAFFSGNIDSALSYLLPISGKTESDIANDALELSLFLEQNKQFVNALTLYAKALLLERSNEYNDAAELYSKASSNAIGSDLAERSLIKSAEMHYTINKPKSKEELLLFLATYPDSFRTDKVLFMLSEIEIEAGDITRAIELLTDILVRFPKSSYVQNARILIRTLRGES